MDNLHVARMTPLLTPAALREAYPVSEELRARIQVQRQEVADVLCGKDPRLLVVVGPCSIHNREGCLEYATQLAQLAARTSDALLVVMRMYFQKPRTTTGWTGLLDDPHMDGTFKAEIGIEVCRQLMLEVASLGLPVATEFLGTTIEPQYFSDLVSFGCIGARTVESQCHRHLVSGLSMPCGFKNRSDGDIRSAVQACQCAASPRGFIGVNIAGEPCMIQTTGNGHLCVVLRGSYTHGPNWDRVLGTRVLLTESGLASAGVVVDCAHGNSGKTVEGQRRVSELLRTAHGVRGGSLRGIMLESYLREGKGEAPDVSLTDPCLSIADTRSLLEGWAHTLRCPRPSDGTSSDPSPESE